MGDNRIPTYYLIMDEEDLEDLRSDIWNDIPLPANLVIDDNTIDADIAYRGSYTREFRKRSYFIEFIEPDNYRGSREIHLNAEYRDPSLIRNKLSLDFFNKLGVLSPESYHANLVRNGTLKGVYLVLESVDDLFLRKRNLPLGPIYYAVNNNANFSYRRKGKKKRSKLSGYQRKFGNDSDNQVLKKFIKKINTTSDKEFAITIPQYLEVDKYLDWLVGVVCTMNNDGFTHNYALYLNRTTGLFEIIPWDYDATWGRKVDGGKMKYDYVPIEGKEGNYLTYRLLRIPVYRKLYKQKLEEIIETKFTISYFKNKITLLHQILRPHILEDPYKRRSINKYDNEPDFIFQFIEERNNYLREHLCKLT